MAGFNQEYNHYSYLNTSVLGQTVTSVPSIQGGTGEKTLKEGTTEYAIRSTFGRLSYNWMGRYLLEGNFRYDGSSKFPKENREPGASATSPSCSSPESGWTTSR